MKFYNFVQNSATKSNELYITGDIVDDDLAEWYSEFGVDCAGHKNFKSELDKCKGDITVYIDSYGGDTMVASRIYTDLLEHEGNITVKIPAIAASAASIIAMAGDKVLMAPTAMMMIHNPWTVAVGDKHEMKATIHVLETVGETIINAYAKKTGLARDEIQKYMDKDGQGSWFDCNEAKSLGFCDGIIGEENNDGFVNQAILNAIKGEKQRIYSRIIRPVDLPKKEKNHVALNTAQSVTIEPAVLYYDENGNPMSYSAYKNQEKENVVTLAEGQTIMGGKTFTATGTGKINSGSTYLKSDMGDNWISITTQEAVNTLESIANDTCQNKIDDKQQAQARKREIEILNLKGKRA